MGTRYRENSEVGYRWVPDTDDISKDEYRWVPGIDQMKNCWYRWVPGTGQIKNCVYRCVPGNGQKQKFVGTDEYRIPIKFQFMPTDDHESLGWRFEI